MNARRTGVGSRGGRPVRSVPALRLPATLRLPVALCLAVAALGLTGCSGRDTAASTPVAASSPPAERLTPQVAAAAFRSFTGNDDIGRAAGDERLTLSWVVDGQSMLTAAAFRRAAFQEEPVPRYTYAKTKFYVPRIGSYPQWFLAVAQRTEDPAAEDSPKSRTALMILTRKEPGERWRLALATLLDKGVKLPHITVDREGYATPLATFDDGLLIQPRFVGAMQATVAEEGKESLAADVMDSGKHTDEHYEDTQDEKKAMKEDGFAYDARFTATQYPVYALRTGDGGGLVLYSMSRDTVVYAKQADRIPIPRNAAHLLDPLIMHEELGVVESHQYAATVPRKTGGEDPPATKTKIIGFAGEPVNASGS